MWASFCEALITGNGIAGNGAYLYSITVNILGGSGFTFSNAMNIPAPGEQITRMALINQNAGPGADEPFDTAARAKSSAPPEGRRPAGATPG